MHALSGPAASTLLACPHCQWVQSVRAAPALAPGYNGLAHRCGHRACEGFFVVLVRLVLRPSPHVVCVGARAMSAWTREALADALAGYRDTEGKPLLTSHDVEYSATVFELTQHPWTPLAPPNPQVARAA